MANYLWTDSTGKLVEAGYDETVDKLSPEQAKDELVNALSLFGRQVSCVMHSDIDYVYDIVSTDELAQKIEFTVCIREMTPGGRSNSNSLKDEQRIQPEAQQINAIYEAGTSGKTAVLLGVYKRDGATVFGAWKPNESNASNPKTGISKQIKINSIAQAMKEGFVQQPKGRGEYACAFRKEFIYFYINNSTWLHGNTTEELMNHIPDTPEMLDASDTHAIRFKTGFQTPFERNRIIFGAPGTGKSYTLKEDCETLLNGTNGSYERVTFHPDYTYSNFVGTYKPVSKLEIDEAGNSKSEIHYEFVPGPFIRVFIDAIKSGKSGAPQPHLLVIEEINRAKVASVFGDVFQLLDRDDDGISDYEVHATEDIRNYLAKELDGESNDFDRIRIPDNMFIWATMNSADQGVFPMDTAFKRRWNFEYLGINHNENQINGKIVLGEGDNNHEIEWNQLRKSINDKLVKEYKVNEDKLLGPFFLSKKVIKTNDDNLIENREAFIAAFKSKVIMYLYEDAAKQHKYRLFDGCDNRKYSSVCEAFDEKGIRIFGDDFQQQYEQQGV